MSTIIICGLIGGSISVFGQSRDFNSERFILDDNAGDGTRNTLTLQVPGTGLSADRTLVFPDGDGTVLTVAGTLTANQILFGSTGGQAAQSANLLWTDASSILSIGAGLFTVDGTTGNTDVGGTFNVDGLSTFVGAVDAQAAGNTVGDGTDAEQLQVNGVDGGAVEVDINGDADVSGNLAVGGDLDVDVDLNVDGDALLNGNVNLGDASGDIVTLNGTLIGPGNGHSLGTVGVNATVITVQGLAGGASEFVVAGDGEVNGALSATSLTVANSATVSGSGSTVGDGTDAEQLQVNGVDGGAVEVDINGDADISGTLSVGSLTLNSDLDMNQNDIVDLGDIAFSTAGSNISNSAGDVTLNDDVAVTGDITPTADNTYALGSDANRWSDVFVNGGSLHVGDANGIGTDEMALGYDGSSTGTIFVNGTAVVNITTAGVSLTGNESISGNLNVGGNTIHVGTLDQQGAVSNSTGNVVINDDVDVSGGVQIGGASAVTNSRLVVDDGHWTSQQTTAPTAAPAGANVTSSTLSNQTDVAGFIDITTSGAPAVGAQATVTFNTAYAVAPIVVMMAANGPGAGVGAYVSRTTTGFTVNFIGLPAAATSYQFFYQVIETQ